MKIALKNIFSIWMLMLGSLMLTSQGPGGIPPPWGLEECEQSCSGEFPNPSPGPEYFECMENCQNAALPIDGSVILLAVVGFLFATVEIYKATKHKKTPM